MRPPSLEKQKRHAARRFALSVMPESLAIVRLDAAAGIPSWATRGSFFSVTRTPDELSIVCEAAAVPSEVQASAAWRALKVHGPFPLSEVGVLAALVAPLAKANVSVLAVATFDTDYLLVNVSQLPAALAALRQAGHRLREAKN